MLSIAYAVAVAEGADVVAAGIHAGDHPIYPDCRPAFVKAFDVMAYIANEGYTRSDLRFYAPFVHRTKTEIVTLGAVLGAPYEQTWSCYKGGEFHCGTCGTCTERKEAFKQADIPDPTRYQA
jgi:7-cyano-7-deazaguanine synthase